jgi:hypothetical protein
MLTKHISLMKKCTHITSGLEEAYRTAARVVHLHSFCIYQQNEAYWHQYKVTPDYMDVCD